MPRMYIAATDRQSWGRSDNLTEAILRSLRHAGTTCETVTVIQVDNENVTQIEMAEITRVNEMGNLIAPPNSTIGDPKTIDATVISRLYDEIGEILAEEDL